MTSSTVILTVDRNQRNLALLNQFLGKASLVTFGITNLADLHQLLDQGTMQAALALVDITGFDATVWTACQRLQKSAIPFLILSPHNSSTIKQQSLDSGAHSVLVKPLVSRELIALIESLMRADV